MSQKLKKYLFIFILCGSLIVIVGIIFKYIEPDTKQQHLKQIEDEAKFNLSSIKLTPHYKGVDIENLYYYKNYYKLSKYSGAQIAKNEYETTEEYDKRSKKTIIKAESEIWNDKIFAFQIADGCIQRVYDIGLRSIKLFMEPAIIYRQLADGEHKYPVSFALLVKGRSHDYGSQYVGQNAFSDKVVVNSYESNYYYIALYNEDQIAQSQSLNGYIFDKQPILIEMDPKTAESIKDSIGVLAITKIKVDNFSASSDMTRSSNSDATYTNPTEIKSKQYYIFTDLIGLWIYNMDTGEIYKKIMISE